MTPPEQLIDHPKLLDDCLEHLRGHTLWGFDTEFIGENSYLPELCLIQVSTAEHLYLIDPIRVKELKPFWQLLIDPARSVIVHAGREEIRLCRAGCGVPPPRVLDIQIGAGLLGYGYPLGHGALIQQILKRRVDKAETLTNWRQRPLTPQQIAYAYDDIRYLIPLWQSLSKRLQSKGRIPWFEEECDRLIRMACANVAATERWRKLKGIGSFDGKRLAILRELYIWRDDEAANLDRPSRSVLRDDLLVEIARRWPKREGDVANLRGVQRHSVPGIFEAVQRGLGYHPSEYPEVMERENDPPQVQVAVSFLQVVLQSIGAKEGITPALMATTSDLRSVVRAQMAEEAMPDDSLLNVGWRREFVLPELLKALRGELALRLGDLDEAMPIEVMPFIAPEEGGA